MTKTEFHQRPFGSAYDPVLNGIAQGLAALYPPVEHPNSFADAADPQRDGTGKEDEDDQ
jgi:hypothetical protein